MATAIIEAYRHHVAERSAVGLPPLPVSAEQTAAMVQALLQGDGTPLMQEEHLQAIARRVSPGVDEAARIKAEFLQRVAAGDVSVPGLDATQACAWLGSMVGGYAVQALVPLLDEPAVAPQAAKALGLMPFIFDSFDDVATRAARGHAAATDVMHAWAEAEWFLSRPAVPQASELVIFKVDGETTTDDLSPATDVSTRPDVPLHALSMLKHPAPGSCRTSWAVAPSVSSMPCARRAGSSPTPATSSAPASRRASRPSTA